MPVIKAENPRSIPSLDGLRACSVALVILAHSSWYLPQAIENSTLFHLIVGNGSAGVAVFFVISGYLITSILLKELDRTGTLSLKHFYFRRSLRIFPPFYVFLAVMAVLWATKTITQHPASFVAAATYLWAYSPGARGYFIGHSWSLSVEEQFYLLWPILLNIVYPRRKAVKTALFLIAIAPVLRVALYFAAPSLRGHEGYMVQGWIDTMMVGCLLALIERNDHWISWLDRHLNAGTALFMACVAFIVTPLLWTLLHGRMAGFYWLFASFTLRAFGIAFVVAYVVRHSHSLAGKFLNGRVMRHVGLMSYSLYLWQQLFMSPDLKLLPFGFLWAFVAAELSFYLVEKPALRLRSRLEERRQIAICLQA